jgi:hypothetical protein
MTSIPDAVPTPEAAPPTVTPATAAAKRPWPGWMVFDRAAVLLIGVCVGAAIGAAFVSESVRAPAPAPARAAAAAPRPQVVIAQDCPMPYPPHLMQALASGRPVTVGVFGDSFGVGVWAALHQMLPKGFQVIQYAKESTGFTRYASLNLEDKARGDLAGQPIDIAVIDFGANDTQGVYDGPRAYPLLSDGWKRAYAARMDRYVKLLRDQGAMVYWVGLPKMRRPEFDRQIEAMEVFYNERMTALGVPYFDVEPLSEDASGAFNVYLPDGPARKPRLMRANDGIHMTFAGYERIAGPVAARIQAYVAHAKAMATVDATPPAPRVPAPQGVAPHGAAPKSATS